MNLKETVDAIRASKLSAISLDVDLSAPENIFALDDLTRLIVESEHLTHISFRHTNLSKFPIDNEIAIAALMRVFQAISQRKDQLTVDLSSNDLGRVPGLCKVILPILMRSQSVVSLDLGSNNLHLLLGNLSRIFDDIENHSLKELRLVSNHFGLAEVGQLLLLWNGFLQHCLGLKKLYLYSNELGKNMDVSALLKALHELPLDQLGLGDNDFGDLVDVMEDIRPFISSLVEHPTLRNLNLSANLLCGFGAGDLMFFFERIITVRRLQELDIDVNELSVIIKDNPEFLSSFSRFIAQTPSIGLTVKYCRGNFDAASLSKIEEQILRSSVGGASTLESSQAVSPKWQTESDSLVDVVESFHQVLSSEAGIREVLDNPDFWQSVEDPRSAQAFFQELHRIHRANTVASVGPGNK